jgi:hypothetical protein
MPAEAIAIRSGKGDHPADILVLMGSYFFGHQTRSNSP